MNILAQLPEDIKQKVFLYLAHPCADMIGDEVERLHLDKVIAFSAEGVVLGRSPNHEGHAQRALVDLEIELDLREFFSVEYFTAYNFYKEYNSFEDYTFIKLSTVIACLLGREPEQN